MAVDKLTSGTKITISNVGANFQGLSSISIRIPLIPERVLEGASLIDCIDSKALPKLADLI
jgi:hypothetical protein